MQCRQCSFEGKLVQGKCARCGYLNVARPGNSLSITHLISSQSQASIPSMPRVQLLRRGRYRFIEQLTLPENQQEQGTAWIASDAQALTPEGRVFIYSINFPEGLTVEKNQLIQSITSRFTELGHHTGFPKFIEVFAEQGIYYLVVQYIEGETLSTVLSKQQDGLPERTVAEYGYQLCTMLALLSQQNPPYIHGSISPDTIIISPDKKRVSLIHLPLFSPTDSLTHKGQPGDPQFEKGHGSVKLLSDIHTVAATLHYAITGYNPKDHTSSFYPPARSLNPAVTEYMETILMKGLRLSSSHRYTRVSDMQKDLASVIASSSQKEKSTDKLSLPLAPHNYQLFRPSLRLGGFIVLISLLLFLGLIFTLIHPFSTTDITQSGVKQVSAAELALEMQMFQKKGIGISDGRLVFDTFTGRSDSDFKKQAGQAIQKGDLSSAVNLLTKAVTVDPTDGEAQIYNENMHILQDGSMYVTIVLGLPVDNSLADLNIARTDMQSAFLAQHEINTHSLLPNGLKLRFLIDSSGANNDDVAQVGQFIVNRVHAGNADQIIAVVGWPYSSQTINVRDIIASVHLPLVAQTASSVALSGSNPYFFRVNPPDDLQGKTLGAVAVQRLHAHTILVLRDPTDTYSVSLANAFTTSAKALHALAINNTRDYFTETTTTVADYEKGIVRDAVAAHADILFLAGLDIDAVRLAHAIGNAARADPTNTVLANLKILGGDAVDTGLLVGQGNGPDAALVTNFPQDMQRLTFTAFGHPDEWNFLGIPKQQQPAFFSDWSGTYQSSAIVANNAANAGNDAILTYDAVHVIVAAIQRVHGPLTGQTLRDALASIGKGTVPAYQGVSGRIAFDGQGNPINKAIVVLHVGRINNTNEITLTQIAGTFK